MVIKREVNGQTMEFELGYHELMEASAEYEYLYAINDILACYDCTESDAQKAADQLMAALRKSNNYGEAYFLELDNVCKELNLRRYDKSEGVADDATPCDCGQHFD